jgi:hypothetical protein
VATGQFDGDDLTVPGLRVGEIRALRTFRLTRPGCLRPVVYQVGRPWEDGANTAHRPTRLDSYQREPWRPRRHWRRPPRGPSFDKFMTNLLDRVISASPVLAFLFDLLALIVLVLDTFWPGSFRDWPLLSNLHRKQR